jgi:hypothetical protein
MLLDFAGGCIRFTNDGPRWHINSRHQTVDFVTSKTVTDPITGVETVEPVHPEITSEGDLLIKMTSTLDVVYTAFTPDETLTSRNITGGVSGGVSDCRIELFQQVNGTRVKLNLTIPADYDKVRGQYSNGWVLVARVPGTEINEEV